VPLKPIPEHITDPDIRRSMEEHRRMVAEYEATNPADALQHTAITEMVSRSVRPLDRILEGKFQAAAWVLGASWGMLAFHFKIARETVMSKASRFLPAHLREQYRYSRHRRSYEEVILHYQVYLKFIKEDPVWLEGCTVEKLAEGLERDAAQLINDIQPSCDDPYLKDAVKEAMGKK
jgi:hypothetical protein